MMRSSCLAAVLLLSLLANCSTAPSIQTVMVVSDPEGADCAVEQASRQVGRVASTPGSVQVQQSVDDLRITCTKATYRTEVVTKSPMVTNIMPVGIGLIAHGRTGTSTSYPPRIRVYMSQSYYPGARDRRHADHAGGGRLARAYAVIIPPVTA